MSHSLELAKEKRWIIKSSLQADEFTLVREMAASLRINPIVAELLYIRGCRTEQDMKTFLSMENEMLCDPFEMKDMRLGVDRILAAVQSGEKITIYGDYDVDGVTSVSTLYLYLASIGGCVSYYIPNRATDGYGVNNSAIDRLHESGTRLIITVDTGITAAEEAEYAATLGMDFVVTDHHECRADLPKACAVINPHRPDCPYPFKDLAGVGVVFKLISALEEVRSGDDRLTVALRVFAEYSDLVAIGTIADVMPIRDENRIIVSQGLLMMQNTKRVGLRALMDASNTKSDKKRSNTKITSGYIGYTLAPRINAAGRILSASIAVELFLTQDYNSAYTIAEELCQANKDRQTEENKIMKEAAKMLETYGSAQENPVIVLDADHWHHGVIGIVSSRITEKYARPSILVSFDGNMTEGTPAPGDIGKGSGRSVKGMNLVDALCYCQDHLVKFGGHELAAGLSVTREMLPSFRRLINQYAKENLRPEDMSPTMEADIQIDFEDLSLPFAESLQILEPYGVGNPVPVFVIRDCRVQEMTGISEGKHTRFLLSDGKQNVQAMFFSNSPASTQVNVGDRVDVLFTVDINEWLGRRNIQLILKDIHSSDVKNADQTNSRSLFESIWSGQPFNSSLDVLPDRNDFASVYRLIVSLVRSGKESVTEDEFVAMTANSKPMIGYVKTKIILKVFMELNIVGIEETEDGYIFSARYTQVKADLDKSSLMKRLRQQQKTD